MDRRKYLVTIGTLATISLSGCSGDGDGDGNSEPSEYEIVIQSQSDELQDSSSVESGDFQAYRLNVPIATQFSCQLDITSGPPVDFFAMDENEFNRYRDEEEFLFLEDYSFESRESIEIEGELTSGEYRFVIDRTNMGFS